ncbi:MAG: ATP synthase F1 subunit epsilon [Candidatus Eremiobacteraeota bacterium]|nr:ATP synthase F1 subunit epsilon [Candidatus Eremiobacteraeota bacterium]MCW5868490.1 ATP synthase F1 subunit epsilon [Candidatus Eremiobacteraeota bacterium]
MSVLTVEVVTPEALKFTGQARQVQLPGVLGEMGVLPNHEPLVSMLNPGVVEVRSPEGTRIFAVAQGFATIQNNKVVCLVDDAVEAGKVDTASVTEKVARLERELAESNDERIRNQLAFLKAQLSLKG